MKNAVRFNKGKPQLHFVCGQWAYEVARVFEFGAIKYEPYNYKKGIALPDVDFMNSAFRHEFAYNGGEDNDKESGLNHIDHSLANLIMLREIQLLGKGRDYRFRE